MERAMGADFSAVRIHEGPEAQAQGAVAFTQGTNIYFAPGQYHPETPGGQELLGHELGHVVQQAQGRVQASRQGKGVAINEDSGLEREADEMGARAAWASELEAERTAQSVPSGRPFQIGESTGAAIQLVRDGTHEKPLEMNDIQEAFDTYRHPDNVRMNAPFIEIGEDLFTALGGRVEIVTVGSQPQGTHVDIRRDVDGTVALRVSELAELTSLEDEWIAVMDELGRVTPFADDYEEAPYHDGDPDQAPTGDRLNLSAWTFRARNGMDIEVRHSGDMTFTAVNHTGEEVCEFSFSLQDHPNEQSHIWLHHMETKDGAQYRRQGIAKRVMQIAWNALGGFQVPYDQHTPDPDEYYLTPDGRYLVDHCLQVGVLPPSCCGMGVRMNDDSSSEEDNDDEQHSGDAESSDDMNVGDDEVHL